LMADSATSRAVVLVSLSSLRSQRLTIPSYVASLRIPSTYLSESGSNYQWGSGGTMI
jgi:hypothetical protein